MSMKAPDAGQGPLALHERSPGHMRLDCSVCAAKGHPYLALFQIQALLASVEVLRSKVVKEETCEQGPCFPTLAATVVLLLVSRPPLETA